MERQAVPKRERENERQKKRRNETKKKEKERCKKDRLNGDRVIVIWLNKL